MVPVTHRLNIISMLSPYSWFFDLIIMKYLTPLVSWFGIYYDFNSQYCGVSLHKFDAQPLRAQTVQVELVTQSCLCTKSVFTHPGGQTQPDTQGRCAEKVRFSS